MENEKLTILKKAAFRAARLLLKPWLTKKELACYLGFSERFIDLNIRPFVSVYKPNPGFGTKILFSREEIDAFIKTKREDADLVIKL